MRGISAIIKKLIHRSRHHRHAKKLSIATAVVVFSLGVWLLIGYQGNSNVVSTPRAEVVPVSTGSGLEIKNQEISSVSPLSGLDANPSLANAPITAIMIENSPAARPQSGLSSAGIVFEALAEGGISRFVALYQGERPNNIGPVRSARPYYVYLIAPFDVAYAHVGGSEAGKAAANKYTINLDQFSYGGSFWRINSRVAPHNVYTSFSRLDQLNEKLGHDSVKAEYILRGEGEQEGLEPANKITVKLTNGSSNYNPSYTYDTDSQTYKRFHGNTAHIDANTGKQLSPDVLVVVKTSHRVIDSVGHLEYDLVGNGQAWIFQNGKVITAKWSKSSYQSQIVFKDNNNDSIPLNPGLAWIALADGVTWQ